MISFDVQTFDLIDDHPLKRQALEHVLYAQGRDFTDLHGEEGSSLLKTLYKTDKPIYAMEQLTQMTMVTLVEKNKPVGVAVWLHPATPEALEVKEIPPRDNMHPKSFIPVSYLGAVFVFLKPEHRSKGWMKQALERLHPHVAAHAQKAHQQGQMPVLSAVGATVNLIKPWALPITSCLSFCKAHQQSLGFRRDVWRHWQESQQEPLGRKGVSAASKWLKEPMALAKVKPLSAKALQKNSISKKLGLQDAPPSRSPASVKKPV